MSEEMVCSTSESEELKQMRLDLKRAEDIFLDFRNDVGRVGQTLLELSKDPSLGVVTRLAIERVWSSLEKAEQNTYRRATRGPG